MGRFISYKNTLAIMWIIISIIIIGLGIFGLVKTIKWRKSDKYDDDYVSDDGIIFLLSLIAFISLILIFLIVLLCNIAGLFQNIFVPEITIINYLKGMNI